MSIFPLLEPMSRIQFHFPISIFLFPFSIFHFPFSYFNFPISIFLFPFSESDQAPEVEIVAAKPGPSIGGANTVPHGQMVNNPPHSGQGFRGARGRGGRRGRGGKW